MAHSKDRGNGKLDEAMTALVHAQALLVQRQAAFVAQNAESEREMAQVRKESAEWQRKIDEWQRKGDARFERIEAILMEHNRILQKLANTIGEKIGFKTQQTQTPEA